MRWVFCSLLLILLAASCAAQDIASGLVAHFPLSDDAADTQVDNLAPVDTLDGAGAPFTGFYASGYGEVPAGWTATDAGVDTVGVQYRESDGEAWTIHLESTSGAVQRLGGYHSGVFTSGQRYRVTMELRRNAAVVGSPVISSYSSLPTIDIGSLSLGVWEAVAIEGVSTSSVYNLFVQVASGEEADVSIRRVRVRPLATLQGGDTTDTLAVGSGSGPGQGPFVDNGMTFDGTGADYVAFNQVQADTSACTLCGWVKFTGSGWQNVLGHYNADHTYFRFLFGQVWLNSGYGPSINDDEWHHVAITSTADLDVSVYVDGVYYGTEESYSSAASHFTQIGTTYNESLNRAFNGDAAELRFYNRALSPQAIARLYEIGMGGDIKTGLVGHWLGRKFTPGASTTIVDESGNGNTATLVGGDNTGDIDEASQTSAIRALGFDGSVDHATHPALSFAGEFTAAGWVSLTGDHGRLFGNVTDTLNRCYITPSSNRVVVNVAGTDRTFDFDAIPASEWCHAVVVRNASNQLRCWINGEESNTGLSAATAGTLAGVETIGRQGGNYGAAQSHCDSRLYNRALTAIDVAKLYRHGLASIPVNNRGGAKLRTYNGQLIGVK